MITPGDRTPAGDRRKRLTRADVVAAATKVAMSGVDEMTMANVAAELGVTAMALYQHVNDKAHLASLVLDGLMSDIEVPPPSYGPWDARLRKLHLDVTEGMTRFPGLIGLGSATENVPRLLDGYLQILLEAGFDAETAAKAYTGLYYLAMGAQHPYHGSYGSPAAIPPVDPAHHATAEAANALRGVPRDDLQTFAMDAYLEGLRRLHRARRRAGRS